MALCLVLAFAMAWSAGAQPAPPPAPPPLSGDWADALREPVDLHADPDLVSAYDRTLLEDAKYGFPKSGSVLEPVSNKALTKPGLKEALENLRAKRREETLAELEKIQNAFLASGGRLSQVDAQRARVLLARDWSILPPGVRDGFNVLLQQSAIAPVKGPELDWVKKIGDGWKKDFAEGFPTAAPDPALDPGALERKLGHWPQPQEIDSPVLARPPPDEIARRIRQVDAATYKDPKTGELKPYSEPIKAMYREVMRYASDQDSAAVLRVLSTQHPVVYQSDKDNAPFAGGFAHWPTPDSPPDQRYPKIVMLESSVAVKSGKSFVQLPQAAPEYYRKLGMTPPNVQALDPAAKPTKVEQEAWGRSEIFADGSRRDVPKPESLSILLLHETLHLDTAGQGMGANAFANEMRSYYAMERMRLNRDQAMGRTADPHYYDYDTWSYFPVTYRANILAAYSSDKVKEVLPDEVTVAGQLARTRRELAATGPGAQKAFEDAYNRRWDRARDNQLAVVQSLQDAGLIGKQDAKAAREKILADDARQRADPKNRAWDYKAVLQDEERRLVNDQELVLTGLLDDYRWHAARGLYYMDKKK